jgi:hypothetical protein
VPSLDLRLQGRRDAGAARGAGERRRAVWTEILDSTSTVEDFVTEVARRYSRELVAERDWLAVVSEFMTVTRSTAGWSWRGWSRQPRRRKS